MPATRIAPSISSQTPVALVVGAGFAGAVHARCLAEAGWRVQVIDRRPHVAGNAHDQVDDTGVRVHTYGPHLFHTNNAAVVHWLGRWGAFVPYRHSVQALLGGGTCVPLPINRTTVNAVFGVALADEDAVRAFLAQQAEPIAAPRDAGEYLRSQIGPTLTDLFFRPYTRKMWRLELEQMDAAVVRRIPLRFDDSRDYFPNDQFQLLPRDGYTAIVQAILDHPSIAVALGTAFDRAMLAACDVCFNSMPIDEYYDTCFGPLPYRSIRFHHRAEPDGYALGQASVVNFTDDRRFTRQTDWSRLPGHVQRSTGRRTVTLEEPCDDHENDMERYYPVKTSDGRNEATYRRYCALAESEPGMRFIGRCGTYQYLDMHQVISQSLKGVADWLAAQ